MSMRAAVFQGLCAVLMAGLFASGCAAAPQSMQSSRSNPAAEGTVKATEGDNGNTAVTIQVKHLAPPAKMWSDAQVYVVWVQPLSAHPQNVGVLKLNADLKGELETVTPHRRFRLLITPEANGQVEVPSHEPVFTTEVERR